VWLLAALSLAIFGRKRTVPISAYE